MHYNTINYAATPPQGYFQIVFAVFLLFKLEKKSEKYVTTKLEGGGVITLFAASLIWSKTVVSLIICIPGLLFGSKLN